MANSFSAPGSMSIAPSDPLAMVFPSCFTSHVPATRSFGLTKKFQFFTRIFSGDTVDACRFRYTYLIAYSPGWGVRSAATSPLLLKSLSLRTPDLSSHHPPYARKVVLLV